MRTKKKVEKKNGVADLKKLNEKLRRVMNDVQERDQRLLDTADTLTKTKKGLEDALARINDQSVEILNERNWFESILERMGDGVAVMDEDGELKFMNGRAKELLGFERGREIPENYKKFVVFKLWSELKKAGDEITKKEVELERPRAAVLQFVISKIENDGVIAVLRDITVEKKIDQMKSDFVANVAHEIRSPMAPIRDALDLVVKGQVGPVNEQQKKFLSIVDSNIRRLSKMIDDLLDLAKIEAGKALISREMADLSELLKGAVDMIGLSANKKNIKLTLKGADRPVEVMCDRDRILQVVMNIMMNSLKFTPENGRVDVTLSELAKKSGGGKRYALISVSDTGPGMTKIEADSLFDRFRRLESAGRVKGAGLGLAISKEIVKMHGGDIWVESDKGKGSTFKFTIAI